MIRHRYSPRAILWKEATLWLWQCPLCNQKAGLGTLSYFLANLRCRNHIRSTHGS